MAFTYTAFVNSLSGLSVTGITRSYTEPPSQINSADLPCMWPWIPDVDRDIITLDASAGLRSASCDLVILVEMELQSRNDVKFSTALALIDALDVALATEASANNEIDSWNIRSMFDDIGNWKIVATVTGSG